MRIPIFLQKLSIFVNKHILRNKKGQSICCMIYINKDKSWFHMFLLKATDMIFFFDKEHSRKSYFLWKKRTENGEEESTMMEFIRGLLAELGIIKPYKNQ